MFPSPGSPAPFQRVHVVAGVRGASSPARLVRLAGGSPEREDRDALASRTDLALLAGADAGERAGPKIPFLSPRLQRRASFQDDVRLFLAVRLVIVLGVVSPARRQPQDIHPPGGDAEALAGIQEP